jgi:uncharacterized Zn finger protein (UPF0148 family)
MKAVLMKMDASEHCPECGALLIRDGGVSICAACGYYGWEGGANDLGRKIDAIPVAFRPIKSQM